MADSIIVNGEERVLGCLPRKAAYGSVCPLLESRVPVIPQSEWKEVDWSHLVKVILNQGNQGSCVGASGSATMMALRAAAGDEHKELSIGSLYGQINGGRDQGAFLSDSIEALSKTGMGPVDYIPHYTWQPNQWPSGYQEVFKQFRALEAYDATSFDQIGSATQKGFITSFGVMIPRRFEPDANGFLPPLRGAKAGGHAMTIVGTKYHDGQWWLKLVNSWDKKWGLNGFAYMDASYFVGTIDAWSLRVVTSDRS